ncbi:MAG: hypothetical protein JJU46_01000 [Balneolaceae bacterium]|nr:hypothetical protein [Balneolaceae bacterium]MCH8547413.1 hypothetical protein [Balneolaceae bacterium]
MKDKNIFLLAGGIGGMLTAFSLSYLFQDLWIGFFSAFVVALIYLYLLDKRMVQTMELPGAKVVIRSLVGCLVVAQLFMALIMYAKADRQKKLLSDIRQTIDSGVIQSDMKNALLVTFRHYHLETDRDGEVTMASIFEELNSDRIGEDGRFITKSLAQMDAAEDPPILYIYDVAGADTVRLTAIAAISNGADPDFANLNGETGKLQVRATLTSGGIDYEREN